MKYRIPFPKLKRVSIFIKKFNSEDYRLCVEIDDGAAFEVLKEKKTTFFFFLYC